jgi:O-succinylbenzoate synthase
LTQARAWHERGWRGVFVIKPAIAGPFSELADWLDVAKPDVVFSSAIETALARARILAFALGRADLNRAVGFGVGSVFGDPRWDGPMMGPLVDHAWCRAVNPAQLWNELP